MILTSMQNTARGRSAIVRWRGLNRQSDIAEGEFEDMQNLSTENAPQLSSCRPSEVLRTYAGTPQALFASSRGLFAVCGGVLYLDGDAKLSGLSDGPKSVVEFWDKLAIFPDKKYYDLKTGATGNIGNGGVYPADGSCPDIDWACVHDNRVFGVHGNTLYACAQGNLQDWTTFIDEDGNPSDTGAYAVEVATPGDFRGVAEYEDHVFFWKPGYMHELYGTMPSKYVVRDDAAAGLLAGGAVAQAGGVLYFASEGGLLRYSGGVPASISRPLALTLGTDAVCAADLRMVYLFAGGALYVYDTLNGLWARMDAPDVRALALYDGCMHALLASGDLVRFGTGTDAVEWYGQTGPTYGDLAALKTVTRLDLRFAFADRTGSLRVLLSADGGEFEEYAAVSAADTQAGALSSRFATPKCTFYKLRLEGRGPVTIYELSRTVLSGGDAT